ncbi:TIR domain-containing protein [Rhodococcus sp. T2V]|uniref:TIR domain-containing protein n=1 Tax=Rhodococcus sp. T2V TaxID=3034164 RepID=UPI0023E2ADD8|nr:TIR domain-containing protein [Rhodococcus sp. T2V]MDF3313465.1 TIR domain-containing protein [Rhodococcus sp. T2V]
MATRFNAAKFQREMRNAQRKAEQEVQRQVRAYNQEVDRVNRANQRKVDDHNRAAQRHNQQVVDRFNRQVASVNAANAKANAHNKATISRLNSQLRAGQSAQYTPAEQELAERVHTALLTQDEREYDTFLSYARIDGSDTGVELRDCLEELGVSVWFDEVAIVPGKSQALQMDKGLRKARCGIALLTPAYLTGRFWTERELGALLHKSTLIPVLHNVTFDEVAEYSGILPDLAGFETSRDAVAVIAQKIATAVLPSQE